MTSALIAILAAMWVAGDTPVGRTMRHWLVERPAVWCARWTRGQLIVLAVALCGGGLLVWLMQHEGLLLLAFSAPEWLALIASVEFTAMVEVLATAFAAGASLRVANVRRWLRTRLGLRAGRARRTRQPERKPAANDEDGPALLRLAA